MIDLKDKQKQQKGNPKHQESTFFKGVGQGKFFDPNPKNPFFSAKPTVQKKAINEAGNGMEQESSNAFEAPSQLKLAGSGAADGNGGMNNTIQMKPGTEAAADGGDPGLPKNEFILFNTNRKAGPGHLELSLKMGGKPAYEKEFENGPVNKVEIGKVETEFARPKQMRGGFVENYGFALAQVDPFKPISIDEGIELTVETKLAELGIGKSANPSISQDQVDQFGENSQTNWKQTKKKVDKNKGQYPDLGVELNLAKLEFHIKGTIDSKNVDNTAIGRMLQTDAPMVYQMIKNGATKIEVEGSYTLGISPGDLKIYNQQREKLKKLEDLVKQADKIDDEVTKIKNNIDVEGRKLDKLAEQRRELLKQGANTSKIDGEIAQQKSKLKGLKGQRNAKLGQARDLSKRAKSLSSQVESLSTKYTSGFGKVIGKKALRLGVAFLKRLNLILAIIGLVEDMIMVAKIIKFWDEIEFMGEGQSLDQKSLFDKTQEGGSQQQGGGANQGGQSIMNPSNSTGSSDSTFLPPYQQGSSPDAYIQNNIEKLITTFPDPVQKLYHALHSSLFANGVRFNDNTIKDFLAITKDVTQEDVNKIMPMISNRPATSIPGLLADLKEAIRIVQKDREKENVGGSSGEEQLEEDKQQAGSYGGKADYAKGMIREVATASAGRTPQGGNTTSRAVNFGISGCDFAGLQKGEIRTFNLQLSFQKGGAVYSITAPVTMRVVRYDRATSSFLFLPVESYGLEYSNGTLFLSPNKQVKVNVKYISK